MRFVAYMEYQEEGIQTYITEKYKVTRHKKVEGNCLKDVQREFWKIFHPFKRDLSILSLVLLNATIKDNSSGNTWAVNDWGRKI